MHHPPELTAPPVAAVLARAAAALHELAGLEFSSMGAEDLTTAVLGYQELHGALEAGEARAVRAFDHAGVWGLDSARSAASWLAWRRHTPLEENRRLLRHAHTAATYPAIEQAWAAGEIGPAHLRALTRLDTPRTHDAFVEGHTTLVDAARTQHWGAFRRACTYWEHHADPDGADRRDEMGHDARALQLHQSYDGQWFGQLTLDPVSGTIVHDTIEEIERQLFEADWADAKARLGHKPNIRDLGRTPAQRRADALVEMATRARAAPPGARRPRPLISVLVGYETFAGPVRELFNRTVLAPAGIARLLGKADIERIVFVTPSRVIDVSKSRRFYRGALRHGIALRDRTCWHPTCDELPQRPEIDHIEEFAHGGHTTEPNSRWGCHHHNHHRSQPRNLDLAGDEDPPPAGGTDPGRGPPGR